MHYFLEPTKFILCARIDVSENFVSLDLDNPLIMWFAFFSLGI
jgi:hypothetical protein